MKRTVHVLSFEPPEGGGVGGFHWFSDREVAYDYFLGEINAPQEEGTTYTLWPVEVDVSLSGAEVREFIDGVRNGEGWPPPGTVYTRWVAPFPKPKPVDRMEVNDRLTILMEDLGLTLSDGELEDLTHRVSDFFDTLGSSPE